VFTIEFDQASARSHERFPLALQKKIARAVFTCVKKAPSGVFSVGFISDARMKQLNSTYRKKHKTTDVLSFSYTDDPSAAYLGDIVISLAQARRQAKKGVRRECVDLLVHGMLHVLGYDHERPADAKKMFPLQASIVEHIL
jgi:probable rRNA maturation factor